MAQFEQPGGRETGALEGEIRRELGKEVAVGDAAVRDAIDAVRTEFDEVAARLHDMPENERTARMDEVIAALKPLAQAIATGRTDRERVTQETIARLKALAGVELTGVTHPPVEFKQILERGNVAPNEIAATLAHIETEANDGTTRTSGNHALAAGFTSLQRFG